MCSRYNLISPPEAVRAAFGLAEVDPFPPRYNIAPGQPVAIVRRMTAGARELRLVRWGLVPAWVKDLSTRQALFSARAETAAGKPSFRGALRHRRCLVPADGYYEWQGPAGARRPFLIRPVKGGLMAMAGLAEHWLGADGSEIETMAILTIAANRTVAAIHPRMPVLVPPEHFEAWLDCRSGDANPVLPLLRPAPDDLLECVAIGTAINSVASEGPELLRAADNRLL